MQLSWGLRKTVGGQPACAATIGNLDGVHRGHQAMLALLRSEARHRGLPACVVTFEPHPRDYFARLFGTSGKAPRRISTLRDKVAEIQRCGIDEVVVLRFDASMAMLTAQGFIDTVLRDGVHARHVLVGDDFRFGADRRGDYALLDAAGPAAGFDVARMTSYDVHGLRVSSSAVRAALDVGDMVTAAGLLGRPFTISGHVVHGRKLGRNLGASPDGAGNGFRTLNVRFGHTRPAASGIFAVRTHGLMPNDDCAPVDGVASLGVRPTVVDSSLVLLEVHCLDWPAHLGLEGGYGKVIRVELLHKLRPEARYDSLAKLTEAIAGDVRDARDWFEAHPVASDAMRPAA